MKIGFDRNMRLGLNILCLYTEGWVTLRTKDMLEFFIYFMISNNFSNTETYPESLNCSQYYYLKVDISVCIIIIF